MDNIHQLSGIYIRQLLNNHFLKRNLNENGNFIRKISLLNI